MGPLWKCRELTFEHILALTVEDDSPRLQVLVAQELSHSQGIRLRFDRLRDVQLLHFLLRLTWLLLWLRWRLLTGRLTLLLLLLHLLLSHHLFSSLCLFLLNELLWCDAQFRGFLLDSLALEFLELLECHAALLCFCLHHCQNLWWNLLLPWRRGTGRGGHGDGFRLCAGFQQDLIQSMIAELHRSQP